MFSKKKAKKNRFGASEDGGDETACGGSASHSGKAGYLQKPAYSLGTSKLSNNKMKSQTMEELRDVSGELERLQRM